MSQQVVANKKPQHLSHISDSSEGCYHWGETVEQLEQHQALQLWRRCCSHAEVSPWCQQCWEPLERHWVWNGIFLWPREEKGFSMRANECRNSLINTHNRNAASWHHFHSKHDLLIHYHTQPLLYDILGTFYDLSTSATPVLVPIDKSDIGSRG